MNMTTSELERDVERSRGRVEQTVDALRDKMSFDQIVDDAARYFRNSGGAQLVSGFGKQLRDNPLPLALIGAGIAWMMFGPGRHRSESHSRSERGYSDRSYDETWASGRHGDDPRSGYYESRYGRGSAAASGRGSDFYRGYEDESGILSEVGSGISQAASSAVEGVRSGLASAASMVGSAAEGARSAASSAASGVGSAASYAADRAGSVASGVGDMAYRFGGTAAGAVRSAGGQAGYYGRQAGQSFVDILEDEPLIIGAVGVAVGAAIGAFLPSTEAEDRLMGETRDSLVEQVSSFAGDQYEKAKDAAGEAFEAVKAEAGAFVGEPSGKGKGMGKDAMASGKPDGGTRSSAGPL